MKDEKEYRVTCTCAYSWWNVVWHSLPADVGQVCPCPRHAWAGRLAQYLPSRGAYGAKQPMGKRALLIPDP